MIDLLIQSTGVEYVDDVVAYFLLFHVFHEINIIAKGGRRRPRGWIFDGTVHRAEEGP